VIDTVLHGADATIDLGRALGRTLAPLTGAVLALSGHLGAGKTTLVKGLAEGLGVAAARQVRSPTFLRIVRYESPGAPALVHVDAYRMTGPRDVFELGLDEDFAAPCVVAIEWPENVAEALPEDRLVVALDHADESHRRVRIESTGEGSNGWLTRLSEVLR
jgi:tRNA threonylcarbamoyladenosine biosynthesis protein TsaE